MSTPSPSSSPSPPSNPPPSAPPSSNPPPSNPPPSNPPPSSPPPSAPPSSNPPPSAPPPSNPPPSNPPPSAPPPSNPPPSAPPPSNPPPSTPPSSPPTAPPPKSPVTPPPTAPVTPAPTSPVTPPPTTPVNPPPKSPETPTPPPPVTPTPSPVTPTPSPPVTPTPSPVTPSPPPPVTPTPSPVTLSPPPPVTPTPAPVSPPPPVTPTPTPVSPPPPFQTPSPPPSVPTPQTPSSHPPPVTPSTSRPPPPPPQRSLLSPPPPPPPSSGSSSVPTGTVIGIAVGAVVVLGAIAGLLFFFVGKRRRRSQATEDLYAPGAPPSSRQQSQTSRPPTTPPLGPSWPYSGSGGGAASHPGSDAAPPFHSPAVSGGTFSYEQLAVATNGFTDANLLGQGGFGHVYRGTLVGKEVAIKKLRPGSRQGDREFRAEIEIIGRVHHKNLVSLVGYCIWGEHRLLVYEYVSNKTLEFHLHGSDRPTLDWPRRWKIALGSAKGLAYLHEDCHPKIIHRDIKAANILLDYNFEPKVSDFGLAKFQPADNTHVSTRVMGTFGYLAPEYASTGKVTDRSDVFSFGVMLLELISGRKPVMSSENSMDETLVGWARPLLTRALEEDVCEELIDSRLETNYDPYDMLRLIACAAAAVRHTARQRPRMSQIVRYMEGEISLEDLQAGVAPGQSVMQRTGGTSQLGTGQLARMAFGSGMQDFTSSEFSEPTSEYGQYRSTPSSGPDTGETETERLRRTGEMDIERMSRRTRPSNTN